MNVNVILAKANMKEEKRINVKKDTLNTITNFIKDFFIDSLGKMYKQKPNDTIKYVKYAVKSKILLK